MQRGHTRRLPDQLGRDNKPFACQFRNCRIDNKAHYRIPSNLGYTGSTFDNSPAARRHRKWRPSQSEDKSLPSLGFPFGKTPWITKLIVKRTAGIADQAKMTRPLLRAGLLMRHLLGKTRKHSWSKARGQELHPY